MAELSFAGQVALVTGGGSGIGRQHVIELTKRGARVMINDFGLDETGRPKAEALAAELAAAGSEVAANTDSVADERLAEAMVEETVARFGRIDMLVNNAGAGGISKTQDLATELLRNVMEVHLYGGFWTLRAALPHMRAQNYGRVVNTTSGMGAFGGPDRAAYVIAKASIIGLTKAAASDNLDRDIMINAISPTAYTPLANRYWAQFPEIDVSKLDVAHVTPAALYMLARTCSFTGETISVGGSRAARIFTAVGPGFKTEDLVAEQIEANLATIFSTEGFSILKDSREQYRFFA